MNRIVFLLIVGCVAWSMWFLGWTAPSALADNGTTVSGTVIGIDSVNQIMRVHVTAVNGQPLNGGPDTNFVDYLVTPNTVVVGPNNRFISQRHVVVGSDIQMQFAGPTATTIVLLSSNYGYYGSHNNYNNYGSSGFVSQPVSSYQGSGVHVQSFGPVKINVPQILVPQVNAVTHQVLQPSRSYTVIHTNPHHSHHCNRK